MAGAASHLDRATGTPHVPELRRTRMREHRAWTAGEYRSKPATTEADAPVTDGENTTVQLHQLPTGNPIFDLPSSQPQIDQLPPGNHPMLPLRRLSDLSRRLPSRRNALSVRCTDKTLHQRVGCGLCRLPGCFVD